MIRVVLAEDSSTVQELLVQLLESAPDIRVIGRGRTGDEAVDLAVRLRPDLVLMDVHMPGMDGLGATKEIMVRAPVPIILVSSSASREEVPLSFDAIRAGALMVIPKPDNPGAPTFNGRRDHLLAMIRAMASVKVVRRWGPRQRTRRPPGPPLRRGTVVGIAASTGGPAALYRLLEGLPGDFPAPILVVQHLALGFAPGLAAWLNGGSPLAVGIAQAGEPLRPRTVYLAPDHRHLAVDAEGRVVLRDSPPVGGHRPSADCLFESLAAAFGPGTMAVVLTGMGRDGVEGLRAVRDAGGRVLAQDEASSVVFGMPRAAIEAGIATEVVPLDDLAAWLVSWTAAREVG
jgi:two-component system, chemotaxis family, protein-glutamate methylesterase/glutaminase